MRKNRRRRHRLNRITPTLPCVPPSLLLEETRLVVVAIVLVGQRVNLHRRLFRRLVAGIPRVAAKTAPLKMIRIHLLISLAKEMA